MCKTRKNSNIFTRLTILITSIIVVMRPQLSYAQKVPLFIFGDSLYDTGMTLHNGVEGAGAEYWPYGETFFGQPSGRYCDGRLIPDFIAENAGLPYPKPYLLPGLNDFTQGVNFASSGACVLVETRPFTINLKKQVEYFIQMVQKLKQQVGQANANALLSKAVYLFNIGGNDYVVLLQNNGNKLPLSPNVKILYMNKILGNLTAHIQTIYKQGGRKFAFQNIGPMGCMPSVKNTLGFTGTCVGEVQQLIKSHNAGFSAVAKRLQTQLPGFKYSIYDSYASSLFRVTYGNRYGFSETKTACCGTGALNGEFTCQKKGSGFKVCSNPSNHLYFDAGHYTQKANQQFAQEFWNGGSNIVAPYNLKTLFSMN